MVYEVSCACGATIRADDQDRLVVRLEAHVKAAHPQIDGEISREQFAGMVELSQGHASRDGAATG